MGDPVRSLNAIMIWQAVATLLLAILGAWLTGVHGAISALLGGAVALAGGIAFKLLAPSSKMSAQSGGRQGWCHRDFALAGAGESQRSCNARIYWNIYCRSDNFFNGDLPAQPGVAGVVRGRQE